MSVTTGNNIQLTTGTVTRQFGTYSMQIDLPTITGFSSTSFKLANMPTIEQDFDLQYESEDLSEIRVNLSEITFEVFDRIGDGKSFLNLVSNMDVNDAMTIQSTVNGRTDYFIAKRENCEYDWLKRSVTVKAIAALRYDVVVQNYAIDAGDVITGTAADGITTRQWVLPQDVLNTFLDVQGSSVTKIVLGRSSFANYTSPRQGQLERNLGFKYSDVLSYENAQNTILKLSVIEGAMMGSMLGYAFYVVRNYDTDTTYNGENTKASISADDIEDYKIIPFEWNVREYDTLFRVTNEYGEPAPADTSPNLYVEKTINELGIGDLDIRYRLRDIVEFRWVAANSQYEELFDNSSPTPRITADLLSWNEHLRDNTREVYAYALGVQDDDYDVRYRLDLTIFGIESVLPFQFIEFGTGISPFVDSKKLRPSKMSYDLEANKVSIEGYFIG
jgi:hypothetical protein